MYTMASNASYFILIFLVSSFLTFLVIADDDHFFVRSLDKKALGLKEEKMTHFRVYWHDVVSGPHPTAVTIVPSKPSTTSAFGAMIMIDDPLTIKPELSSKLVGRAQGFYALASQEEPGLLMAMNFAFIEGKYNGSTITILGRNIVFSKVREMPIIGGSGLFRFARGYVQARTHTYTPKTGDAIVEYNVYVLHY